MPASACAGTVDLQGTGRRDVLAGRSVDADAAVREPASHKAKAFLEFPFAGVECRAASSRLDVLGSVADRRNGVSREASGSAVDCHGFL